MNLIELDSQQFGEVLEPYRGELQAHCYRMMGSIQDAEDMVQEAFLRAWRHRETYAGRASLRAWLYKIATNSCLDSLKKSSRRVVPRTHQDVSLAADPIPPEVLEPMWLQPYPDELLITADNPSPDTVVAERENIALAFITALQLLPPRQRAVLILRDVLEWQAQEVAELLDMTVSAVKSALHRARTTLKTHQESIAADEGQFALDESAQTLLENYVQAWQNANVDALLQLLKDDATFSMPPIPSWYRGREEIRTLVSKTIFSGAAQGRWHLIPAKANLQIAFGLYRRGQDHYEAYGLQVLTFQGKQIADITTFRDNDLVPRFNLPRVLPLGGI